MGIHGLLRYSFGLYNSRIRIEKFTFYDIIIKIRIHAKEVKNMTASTMEQIERHLKTHSKRFVEDCSAIDTIKYVFKSNGKINADFSFNDK